LVDRYGPDEVSGVITVRSDLRQLVSVRQGIQGVVRLVCRLRCIAQRIGSPNRINRVICLEQGAYQYPSTRDRG